MSLIKGKKAQTKKSFSENIRREIKVAKAKSKPGNFSSFFKMIKWLFRLHALLAERIKLFNSAAE